MNTCWRCQKPMGTCLCQDESTDWCRGCSRCAIHCICTQLNNEPAPEAPPAVPAIPPPQRLTPPMVNPTPTRSASEAAFPRLADLGPDGPLETNPRGGIQSRLAFRSDLLPPLAVMRVAHVLTDKAKIYGKDNWRKIDRTDHLNHAAAHIFAFFSGDQSDDHLTHAACRILFALETTDENDPAPSQQLCG